MKNVLKVESKAKYKIMTNKWKNIFSKLENWIDN